MTLEQRIERLEAIEAIKKVQGKYYRCVDTKSWTELGEVFAPKFHTAFSDGRLVFDHYDGDDGLRKYYEDNMNGQLSQHNGHTPEIEIAEDLQTAKAHWYLHDYLIVPTPKREYGIRGTAIYDIEYAKFGEDWKITYIGYKRIYEESWNRDEPSKKHRITEDMFSGKEHQGAVTIQGDTQLNK
ncbi:MAG: nuclear transport factor 2 family protein [Oscillospiraceae bacterium]